MKTYTNTLPEKVQQLGINTYAYNYDIKEEENGYSCETEIFDTYPTRGLVINRLVSNKYPNGAEQAVLRKGIKDPLNEEYLEYYEFIESIKKLVDI